MAGGAPDVYVHAHPLRMLLRELCRLEKRFVVFLGFQTDGQFVEPRGVESPAGGDQRRLPVREARRPGKASGLGDSAQVAPSVCLSISLFLSETRECESLSWFCSCSGPVAASE